MKNYTHFLVRSSINPSLILCTDGEFHHQSIVGPGGYCAKLYKTERGARQVRNGDSIIVAPCTELGIERGFTTARAS